MSENATVDHVVLLHGLSRSSDIMKKMEEYLRIHGYFIHNLSYPSTAHRIEDLAENLYRKIHVLAKNPKFTLHFVGHSLGGILIRCILQQHSIANLGRVVMIGVPNHGTEVADFLQRFAFYRKAYGPAGCQLGVRDNALLASLPAATYPCGVISGSKSTLLDKPFCWFLLPADNDGKVTVESTRLEGMTDHIVINASHPHLPKYPETMRQTAFFLSQGHFEKS